MATTASSKLHVSSYAYRAQERRLQECLRALRAPGWEQRLAPLAQHMAQKHLVRGRHAGAPLRHLDLDLLRVALSRLVSEQWEDGSLIYQLVVEGQDPAVVAAERGVSGPALVELLRDAVDELAVAYEDTANGHLDPSPVEQARSVLAGAAKRSAARCSVRLIGSRRVHASLCGSTTVMASQTCAGRQRVPVINYALHDSVVTKVAGFVHICPHTPEYVRMGGPQGSSARGQRSSPVRPSAAFPPAAPQRPRACYDEDAGALPLRLLVDLKRTRASMRFRTPRYTIVAPTRSPARRGGHP